MQKLNSKNENLIKLAQRGGNDADVVLLDEIFVVDAKVDQVATDLTKKIEQVDEKSKYFERLAAVFENVKEIMKGNQGDKGEKGDRGESIRGEKGDQGIQGEKGDKGDQGDTGPAGVDGQNGTDGQDGKDGSSDNNIQIRDKIESLRGKNRLKITSLDGAQELIDDVAEIKTRPAKTGFFGGARGVYLYVNGVKKGLINSLNIVGTGVATSVVNGLLTITITGSSGGSAIEIPTGTLDGSNTVFNVVNAPVYIIVDGVSKFAFDVDGTTPLHYTYVAGVITIIDGAAPTQFIRSVYSAS